MAKTQAPAGEVFDRTRNDAGAPQRGNRGFPWDDFDPEWYVRHNYAELRDDDRGILKRVRTHFARELGGTGPQLRGIDVGSGANLYPALTMLPYCQEITLWELSTNNVKWLNDEVRFCSPLWFEYWDVLKQHGAHSAIGGPRELLSARAKPRKGDLFKLPRREWDMGTMFFVAESLSEQEREFKTAIERFIGALKPGAPFAAAFMRDSSGYYVDRLRFPAVAVSEVDVKHSLAPFADQLETRSVQAEKSLRDGYRGMILALGRVGRTRT